MVVKTELKDCWFYLLLNMVNFLFIRDASLRPWKKKNELTSSNYPYMGRIPGKALNSFHHKVIDAVNHAPDNTAHVKYSNLNFFLLRCVRLPDWEINFSGKIFQLIKTEPEKVKEKTEIISQSCENQSRASQSTLNTFIANNKREYSLVTFLLLAIYWL